MFKIADIPEQIEPGTYKAQLAGSTIETGGQFPTKQNPNGDYRKWDWLVEVPGKEGLVEFSDFTSLFTGPKSDTYKRLTALLGRAPLKGEEIPNPVGKTVLLGIVHKDSGYAKIASISHYVAPQMSTEGTPS